MGNTELKEKYCREFGYGYFNKHNENEYTKWLESELLEALTQVKNNGVLDDVSKPLAPKEVKSCMKADLKCGEVCKEHCGASWC